MTLAGRLRQILPAGIVLTDSDALECYGQDETEDLVFKPAVVVKPVNTVQVVEVMRFAHQERVPVTPRGAGTGLSGGALPVEGGIVLSTESTNRIVEIDTQNLVAVVEPGVITQVLQEEVDGRRGQPQRAWALHANQDEADERDRRARDHLHKE